MSAHQLKTVSASDLRKEKGSDLLSYANALQTALGQTLTKSFKDKSAVIKKITNLRGMAAVAQAAENKNQPKLPKLTTPEPIKNVQPAPTSPPVEPTPPKVAPKKVKKPKKTTKATGTRGAKADFLRNVGETVRVPRVREGKTSLRQLAYEMLCTGCTVKELIQLMVDWHKKNKLNSPLIGHRLRALEIIRLLNYQNGFGFYNVGDAIHLTTKQADVDKARKAATKAQPKGEELL